MICFRHLVFTLLAIGIGSLSASAWELTDALDQQGDALWSMTPDDFMNRYREDDFRWTSQSRRTARAFRSSTTVFGETSVEVLAKFGDRGMTALGASVYNRGDMGHLSFDRYESTIQSLRTSLDSRFGPGTELDDQLKSAGVKRDAWYWKKGATQARLLTSYSTRFGQAGEDRPEYIRVILEPYDKAADPTLAINRLRLRDKANEVSTSSLRERVVREADGDVFIEGIPMVDQGDKGYCAVATTARILQYYGMPGDQHELAQLVNTTAGGGTNPEVMLDTMKMIGSKLDCKVRVLEAYDVDDYLKLIDRYNREARREDRREIQTGRMIHISSIYSNMDPSLLRDVRLKSRGDFKRFIDDIEESVAEGIPLSWSVIVGIVDENPPITGAGGHLRLIIGHNPKTGEVLYSDTWGRGHEKKRMKAEDAWMITTGLYRVEPRYTTR